MAACGSLQPMFEKPLPTETPQTLLESFSSSSLAELFGELHFKETSHQPFPNIPSTFHLDPQNTAFHENDEKDKTPKIIINSTCRSSSNNNNSHKKSASFSLNSESLQMCTEGLGFESSSDAEDMKNEELPRKDKKMSKKEKMMLRRRRACSLGAFPPPISSIGKSGKPSVSFKSYRQDGRFVLKEVRAPTQEFLHSCREDGRLRMQFVQPNDEFSEEFKELEQVEQRNL